MRAGDGAGGGPCCPTAAAATCADPVAAAPAAAPAISAALPDWAYTSVCCSYEGLMMNDVPHNKGVLVFGNGLGGGIQKADRGDKCALLWLPAWPFVRHCLAGCLLACPIRRGSCSYDGRHVGAAAAAAASSSGGGSRMRGTGGSRGAPRL